MAAMEADGAAGDRAQYGVMVQHMAGGGAHCGALDASAWLRLAYIHACRQAHRENGGQN
jgi:hypothetical protein